MRENLGAIFFFVFVFFVVFFFVFFSAGSKMCNKVDTKYDSDDKVGIIRNELLFLWILSMYKLRRITHKLNIKPFGLFSL